MFRSRVVNPRWIAAMGRHGYKGAFELAATVDYLFGYDATAGVVTTGCTSSSPRSTCSTPRSRVHAPVQSLGAARHRRRLLEAADRGSGTFPTPRRWTGCARPTSTPKATSKAASETVGEPVDSPAPYWRHPGVGRQRDVPEPVHVDVHRDHRVTAAHLAWRCRRPRNR